MSKRSCPSPERALLIRDAEFAADRAHVRCRDGRIAEIGTGLVASRDEDVIEARGGALLPGLHDHHIHLFALAAARASVKCGPPDVSDRDGLAAALAGAATGEWIRGIGYHESVAGMLDCRSLDALVADRPVRIQHRSGKMWFVNSAAAKTLGFDADFNGRLFRQDEWLREHVATDVDLAAVSRELASYGVTGVTDATPSNDDETGARITAAGVRQRVCPMGGEHLSRGTLKIMLDEHELPDFDALRSRIAEAHGRGRPTATHCVTRTELVFALSALMEAGTMPGDRIEHASVTDDATMGLVVEAGVCVVTQPNFILERGEQYLADVEPADHPYLYRCRGFLDAGVHLGGGTDAPFGEPDPWVAIRAAVTRRTRDGNVIGPNESLSPERALALFTTPAEDPGGAPRRIAVGEAADMCLLDRGWQEARESLSHEHVAATILGGEVIFRREHALGPSRP
ncbi:MAG: amidohydrolase family protein [Gammaproteobacteria bacterium]|nr:amidohydrolase family protein [Gammaproteobacteria bacterium]